MRFFKHTIYIIISFLLMSPTHYIFGAQSTSTSFMIEDAVIGGLGGISTSTSFELDDSGGDTALGASSSTNFSGEAGALYFLQYSPRSQNWRWYDDEANETPSTPLADENTAPTDIADQNVIKLRMTVKADHIAGKDIKLKLQFSEYSGFSQDVYDVVEIGACTANSIWCYDDGGGVDNEKISTKVLSDADSCLFGVGKGCGTHNESGISVSDFKHKKNSAAEFEFTVKQAGAPANKVYFFRAFDVKNQKSVPLLPGMTYPSLSTAGASLNFTISGIGVETETEGIITDVTTTPASIDFGVLSLDTKIEAAQRLTVSTSAGGGYQIFVKERQGLLGPAEISPITATNESPLNWTAACVSPATGCYGYHTGDDGLAGGSARFATNDTYAKLESTAKEVVYSSAPVSGEATDVVYSVWITNQQEAGIYESSLLYIIVPTF